MTLSSIGASNRVVAYTVHESAKPAPAAVERADGFVFVKDGFNWWAFLFAPLWMLVNRLWLAFLGYVVVAAVLGGILFLLDAGMAWTTLVSLALNLIVAFEADSMQRWTLERKGWRMIGTVSGANMRECERRFLERWIGAQDQNGSAAAVDGQV
ncbi:MAG: DUF2628 domain-containing protein [Alphaproteobacteria bacterium]|nr:DUF2628 domain-containing protein [Alphaproteobacteria bacterium]